MSTFSEREAAYLDEQRLGRLATVGSGDRPHVVPVGFRYDGAAGAIHVGGHGFGETRKFRDAVDNPHVAFVVDDLESVDPWRPRGVEVRGLAETHTEGGEHLGPGYDAAWLRIVSEKVVSWGLEGDRG